MQQFFHMNQVSILLFIYYLFPNISYKGNICEKNKDTSNLTIGGVQNLVLELETCPRTELFSSDVFPE